MTAVPVTAVHMTDQNARRSREEHNEVQATNLTRTDAQQRARLLAVESYDIELDLTSSTETFRYDTQTSARPCSA